MIYGGKTSKTLSEVMPVENISKNLQSFLEISPMQKEVRMSGPLDLRKDSQSTKFERRPQILVKLSFRELCNSK